MKLFFLCKRRPQGRDIFTRPYGRFFHIPRLLTQRGHSVSILLLSYLKEPPFTKERDGITWISESVYPFGPGPYFRRVRETIKNFQPDWIVGFSDIYYGIIAEYFAKKFGINSLIDAYDNYESYIPWCKPLHWVWRKALSTATAVTAAGPQLAGLIQQYRIGRPVYIIPMAADSAFKPMDRKECRSQLRLPLEERLIGYCGSIDHNRGINSLFDAFSKLCQKRSDVRLVLSGRKDRSIDLPHRSRWLGYLPDKDMPVLLNSVDVLTVTGSLSAFGRYSYPVKLYEAISCHVPVVATATEPATWILNDQKQFLSKIQDAGDLSRKIEHLLNIGRIDYADINSWDKSTDKFEMVLMAHPPKNAFMI